MSRYLKKIEMEKVATEIADAMIENDWTILELSANYLIPKSTIYRYLTVDLKCIDDDKFVQCRNIVNRHKHIKRPRGRRY